MSAAAFRELFNNPAFRLWYSKELQKPNAVSSSFVGIGRKESKSFVSKSVGDFILSREKLTEIFGEEIAKTLIQQAKNDIEVFDIVTYRNIAGQEQIIFSDIKFDNANKLVENYLRLLAKDIDPAKISGKLQVFFENNPQDIGHVFGFTNTLLTRAKESVKEDLLKSAEKQVKSAEKIGDVKGIQEAQNYLTATLKQLNAFDSFIDSLVDILEDYDIASSEIKGLDLDVNLKYRKTQQNWLFTWESSAAQQQVGSKLATILGTIKQTKIGGKGVRGLFASLFTVKESEKDKLVQNLLNNLVQEFIDKSIANPSSEKLDILRQKTSPPFLDLIEDKIFENLGGKRKYGESYTGNINLKPVKAVRITKKPVTNTTVSKLVKNKKELKKLKAKVNTELIKVKNFKPETINLTNLLTVLNGSLHDQIRRNMGTGNSTNVLNYRSGRFAQSVKVEKVSESRQGMITAFYSYMKNPYATFSEGGRQQLPRSRDPKLLISKSIREIASSLVGNRLRAVNV